MLNEPRKYGITDYSGEENHLAMAVNWNGHVSPNKFIQFDIAGKSAIIKKEELLAILIGLMTTEEEQTELMPAVQRRVKMFTKMVKIKATRNIVIGEEMIFPVSFSSSDIYG